jgi:hypothetical protein
MGSERYFVSGEGEVSLTRVAMCSGVRQGRVIFIF